jgi:hypothetical protein
MHQNTDAIAHTKIGEKIFLIYIHQLIHLDSQAEENALGEIIRVH